MSSASRSSVEWRVGSWQRLWMAPGGRLIGLCGGGGDYSRPGRVPGGDCWVSVAADTREICDAAASRVDAATAPPGTLGPH